jgi:magnesium transporter
MACAWRVGTDFVPTSPVRNVGPVGTSRHLGTKGEDVSSRRVTFETAAAHATPHVPIASPSALVQHVRDALTDRRYECASHVVVCEADRFLGIVTIEALLQAPGGSTVGAAMDRDAPFVAPGVDQERAAWDAVRHGESALAVVNAEGRFVGLIPPSRLLAVLLAEHEEDLSRLGGFLKSSSLARGTSEESVLRRLWHRLPWLIVGLGGALLAADIIAEFEGLLRVHVILAFFMPGIVYLADAVGTQTETVIVRGLSLGVPIRRMVVREILAGILIGLALAALTGPLVWWHWGDSRLAVSVCVSVLAAAATATFAAMLLPWLFSSLRLDPAFGSGPLATVIQDLLSIWIYLNVAAVAA